MMLDKQDREALNAFLRDEGFSLSGDLVHSSPVRSTTREVHRSENAVIVVVTTGDTHGDVLVPDGIRLERFRKNPVVLFAHGYDGLPVARSLWERIRYVDTSGVPDLIAKPQFHLDTELSREVWDLLQQGLLSSWSLGFIPTEWEPVGEGFRITKWELLEYSCGPAPHEDELLRRELKAGRISAPSLLKALRLTRETEPT